VRFLGYILNERRSSVSVVKQQSGIYQFPSLREPQPLVSFEVLKYVVLGATKPVLRPIDDGSISKTKEVQHSITLTGKMVVAAHLDTARIGTCRSCRR
jgi:hypothetical protein